MGKTNVKQEKEINFMKLRTKIITATLALLSVFAVAAFATHGSFAQDGQKRHPRMGRGFGGPGGGPGMGQGRGMLPLRFLDLTDAQKEQVKAIHEAEKAKVEPLLTQLREAHTAMREATANGQFNEEQIRAIAAKQSQAQVELAVSHARVQAQIYQLLTAEQRAKLDKFAQERKTRMENRRERKQND
ncbi:MAG: Spy/CpxP family protein refolding chaperone [Blastocatellales bacterium]